MFQLNSKQGKLILTTVILVSGVMAITGRVLSIAISRIQSEFLASMTEVQWVFNLSLLVVATFTLISGTISDKYGIKKIFVLGIGAFVIGCIFSGLSQNIETLILSQGVCGLGIVLMGPCCLSIINACFEGGERSRSTAIWVGIGAFFGVAGLLFGGYMVEFWGWRIPFFIIAGLAVVVLLIAIKYVPFINPDKSIRFSLFQAFSLAIGLLGFSYVLINFNEINLLEIESLGIFTIAILGLVSFFTFQVRSKFPLIPNQLFSERELVWANIITFLLYFCLNGLYIYAIINFQEQYAYSPSMAGLAILPPSLVVALFSGSLGKYADKYGNRLIYYFR